MNYYEHHIGDYDQATAHLSACEDGIYGRLLRRYYATEKPLESDIGLLQRKVRARTKEEKQAVTDVLNEFFSPMADGWHQKTCDEVLEKFRAGAPEREAKKANAETRLQRHRDERAALFKIVNAAGEHYPYNVAINELRAAAERVQSATPATALQERSATFHATAPATPATATHPPVPSTQYPVISPSLRSGESANKSRKPRQLREDKTLTAYLAECKAAGCKAVPDDHHVRRYCADAGITTEMLQVAWVVFAEKYTTGTSKAKRYRDWPGTFANAVQDGWLKLWYAGEEGKVAWSSTGMLRRKALDERQRAKEADHVPA